MNCCDNIIIMKNRCIYHTSSVMCRRGGVLEGVGSGGGGAEKGREGAGRGSMDTAR